ncbi:UDP-N-acetylmuramoyl-L-alanine--D-glutamate ligase [Reinekea marinisedimentorum]|uniref:UDP-N-acetylmuramoylalanine--D-glutamate ligase n=1 Tax=Reinekea marinisedimentorum TaxID=230495 RepID=A0A4V2UJW7_9GAMM|nr:UDP-N-acetylmuramoyl-L-alanine--D-glutamate ligase [Reinekea marinisedimentorum]TCS41718.1 UDP-N-acetylmuramoylalanine--D-glutamate ligase [Reinekea marinisedimentorum]
MKKLDLTKHYLVVGLGVTGLSCVRYLVARGCVVSVIDSREKPANIETLKAEFPNVKVHLGSFDETVLAGADVLVMSPGVPLATPAIRKAIENGAEVSSDIELFLNEFTGKLVAITGSNAKSTVTQWLGETLKAGGNKTLVAGNIGLPVLTAVDEAFDVAVLELSSFQLELLAELNADAAVILNISEDHMDRYDSLVSYRNAKLKIFNGAKHIVVNRDDPQTYPAAGVDAEMTAFGVNDAAASGYGLAEIEGRPYLVRGDQPLMAEADLALPGRHNTSNALAVFALADALANPVAATVSALKDFAGLPYRCQLVGEKDGVRFFNDSKATNVGSVLAALNGLAGTGKKNIILLAGGQGKGQDFQPLKEIVDSACKAVFLFGEDKDKLNRVFPAAEVKNTLAESFAAAVQLADEGDAILFSPACASFDQFANYVARGEAFNELVGGVL